MLASAPASSSPDLRTTGSQTLVVRTGPYTLEVENVEYRDATYSGAFGCNSQAEITVDITEDNTTTVEVIYTLVGSVEENSGCYSVATFNQNNLDEPLYTSFTISTFGQPPLVGFSPSEDRTYVLRVRGELDVVDYRVRAQYLSEPPEERQEPNVLNYGDTATGAVTSGSFDSYRFAGTANEPVLFTFSYDVEDSRYRSNYLVVFYRVGQEEPLETSFQYSNFAQPPEIDFTPQEDGDYLVRVVGTGREGTSLVRYSFAFERLE